MSDVRTLVLVRHAKAEPHGTRPDHERELTERGMRDAAEIGRWLKQESISPDFVWCSTSARTRQTWAAAVETSGAGSIVDHEQRIYEASPRNLLEVLRETPKEAHTVVLVGHAPGVPALAAGLTEGNSAVDFGDHFVTSGVAVLDVPVRWADLVAGVASVRSIFVGRG
ncbi:histidine phosphatase family protein [Yimella sp. cx-573]|nr:histidine phosphatase family protein [Yimella sp. cx-573]